MSAFPNAGLPGGVILSEDRQSDSALVEIWQADLSQVEPDDSLLNAEEIGRAGRFLSSVPSLRFRRSRTLLKQCLARYLDIEPARVTLAAEANGKPRLAADPPPVHFNVSHSHDQWVLAVGRQPLGIDVEVVREMENFQGLARRFFSPLEAEELLALPCELQREAFFRVWTRKEAILKATGMGLAMMLDSFAVSVCPLESVRLRWMRNDPNAGRKWTISDIASSAGAVASLAVMAPSVELAYRS